jgi:hypothetical protein
MVAPESFNESFTGRETLPFDWVQAAVYTFQQSTLEAIEARSIFHISPPKIMTLWCSSSKAINPDQDNYRTCESLAALALT